MADAADVAIRRALISVSDKTGVVELARALRGWRVEILSPAAPPRRSKGAGLAVTDVAEHTGFPEMMDGRLKTLHPKVHGGLLAIRGNAEHDAAAAATASPPSTCWWSISIPSRQPSRRARRSTTASRTSISAARP